MTSASSPSPTLTIIAAAPWNSLVREGPQSRPCKRDRANNIRNTAKGATQRQSIIQVSENQDMGWQGILENSFTELTVHPTLQKGHQREVSSGVPPRAELWPCPSLQSALQDLEYGQSLSMAQLQAGDHRRAAIVRAS